MAQLVENKTSFLLKNGAICRVGHWLYFMTTNIIEEFFNHRQNCLIVYKEFYATSVYGLFTIWVLDIGLNSGMQQ